MKEIKLVHLLQLEMGSVSCPKAEVLTPHLMRCFMSLKHLVLDASQPLTSLPGCWSKRALRAILRHQSRTHLKIGLCLM